MAGTKVPGRISSDKSFLELPRVIRIDPDRPFVAQLSDHLDGPLEMLVLLELAS